MQAGYVNSPFSHGYFPHEITRRTEIRLKRLPDTTTASSFVVGCSTVTVRPYAVESREDAMLVTEQITPAAPDIAPTSVWIFILPQTNPLPDSMSTIWL
ncbi:hypothetical protein TNCV_2202221 [Trichonephila clavipes]|uniref:Uncharacterized protein n=1 Tax=Trichonephila clavipes TaxID=2585209 RepID=A0A8X6R8C1_TRICX|nr:hypothetical protein TNCV_2202221 [Trichonephila clavipes]